jgi:predicted transcriptional regulator YdeE
MTNTDPHLQDRPAVPFVGTTTGVTTTTFAQIADRIPELVGALVSRGITPAGAPFFRYLDLRGDSMTVQVGVPVPDGAELPDDAVPFALESGALPAGRYACLTHVGPFDGLWDATARLLTWAKEQDLRFDTDTVDEVERWAGRLEIYLTDLRTETDPSRYRTDLAFKLAD